MTQPKTDHPARGMGVRAGLQSGDRVDQTFGCRQSNPQTCGKHSLAGICAFARADGMCFAPPRTWKATFARLGAQEEVARANGGKK
jgi:hypothetical protein